MSATIILTVYLKHDNPLSNHYRNRDRVGQCRRDVQEEYGGRGLRTSQHREPLQLKCKRVMCKCNTVARCLTFWSTPSRFCCIVCGCVCVCDSVYICSRMYASVCVYVLSLKHISIFSFARYFQHQHPNRIDHTLWKLALNVLCPHMTLPAVLAAFSFSYF